MKCSSGTGAEPAGSQEPRIRYREPYELTDGEGCADLAAGYGLSPDAWQRAVIDDWLACDGEGRYVHGTCGLSVPRQNGKNGVLEMVELFKIAVQGRKVLHTAHEVKTARKAFLRLCSFFENERAYPEMVELALTIRRTNGQEAILLKNGGSVEFIARSKSSGRGFTVDDVVCDEAQEMTDEQLAALRSTNSAAPSGNPQMMYTGTPTPPTSPGTVFERTRAKAVNGVGHRLCWLEWSVAEMPGRETPQGEVMRLAYETNPALGIRVHESVVLDELNDMGPDTFARERLGWWMGATSAHVIDPASWDGLRADEVPGGGKLAFGVKFSPDGRVCVAGARSYEGAPAAVELVFDEAASRGTAWLADWLNERRGEIAEVSIDGNGSSALVDKLAAVHFPPQAIRACGSREVAAAAVSLVDALGEGSFRHTGQRRLTESAKQAEKRPIGRNGAWGFGGADSAPIEAASLALHAAATTRRNPGRGCKLI